MSVIIIDVAFMIDIMICFRTTIIDKNGKEITDVKSIAKEYLKGNFMVDFIAGIPLEYFIASDASDDLTVKLQGLLKLGRLLRINRIIRFLKSNIEVKAGAQLLNLILFLIIYLHFYACILWLLVKDGKTWTPYYL